MGVGSWGNHIGTYAAISNMNRRGGGGGGGDDEEFRVLLALMGFACLSFVLVIVVLVLGRDQYQRETIYSLNTFSCSANNFSRVQRCTVLDYQNLWVWQEESELDTSKMGIPYVHSHKHHTVKHIDCVGWDLEDVCYFNIEKITDLGKWRKVDR